MTFMGYENKLNEFVNRYGNLYNRLNLNHYLLKYTYVENWEHEIEENYTSISMGFLLKLSQILGLRVEYTTSYLLPYLNTKWRETFHFSDNEIKDLFSTGLFVMEKDNTISQNWI